MNERCLVSVDVRPNPIPLEIRARRMDGDPSFPMIARLSDRYVSRTLDPGG
jgi:hypothetical protein